jgi:hypothetical protein
VGDRLARFLREPDGRLMRFLGGEVGSLDLLDQGGHLRESLPAKRASLSSDSSRDHHSAERLMTLNR